MKNVKLFTGGVKGGKTVMFYTGCVFTIHNPCAKITRIVWLCSFLVPARKEPKESGIRGVHGALPRGKCTPLCISRRIAVARCKTHRFPAGREGFLGEGAFLYSASPTPTSLVTFLFGDKKVTCSRNMNDPLRQLNVPSAVLASSELFFFFFLA